MTAALMLALGGAFAGLFVDRNFQCGCEYGNCGCRPIGTPYITPQQTTPLGPTLLPYASPTRPTLTFPNPGQPTLPPGATYVPTIQQPPTIGPTWTPPATDTPVPTDPFPPTPTTIFLTPFTPTPTWTPGPPTNTPTVTPTPTPIPTFTPTNTATPRPTPTQVSCGNLVFDYSFYPTTLIVRYITTPPLTNPLLQILPNTFTPTYNGYIAGAHEWSVVVPPYYSGLVRFRVFDDPNLLLQCDVNWQSWY